jgi:hypothetical protein
VRVALAALVLSYAPAAELARFADARIAESSGVSASARSDDVLFTHNDSGDVARFFAVDRRGATLGVFDVDGARAEDWEDMARGRVDDGGPALFLADIGDNFRRRRSVTVYVVREPVVHGDAVVPVARRRELRYEDGPHDAEALLVHPRDNAVFVVTKERTGAAGVYRADGDTLRRVGEVRLDPLVRRPGAYAKAVTSGEIAPDGMRVVLRTPFEAFEWDIAEGGVPAAFNDTPRRIALPETEQGEAVAYTRDGRSLVTTSEGVGAPLHLVAGDTAGPDLLALREPPAPSGRRADRRWQWVVGAGVGAGVLTVLGRALGGRRRRRRRPPPSGPRAA